jgi:hypothetical protein
LENGNKSKKNNDRRSVPVIDDQEEKSDSGNEEDGEVEVEVADEDEESSISKEKSDMMTTKHIQSSNTKTQNVPNKSPTKSKKENTCFLTSYIFNL